MNADDTNADAGRPKRIPQDHERRLRKLEWRMGLVWGALGLVAFQNPELLQHLVKMVVK